MKTDVLTLRKAMALLKPVIPRRSTLPTTQYILIKDNCFTATNLECTVVVNLPGADDDILVPFKELNDFLKKLPGENVIEINKVNQRVINDRADSHTITTIEILSYNIQSEMLKSDGVSMRLVGNMAVEDFPPIPVIKDAIVSSYTVDRNDFVSTLLEAAIYASTEHTRPVLNGVFADIDNGVINVVSTDGFRLYHNEVRTESPGKDSVVIPLDSVNTLINLIQKSVISNTKIKNGNFTISDLVNNSESVTMTIIKQKDETEEDGAEVARLVRFTVGNNELITSVVLGTFPKYRNLIPTSTPDNILKFYADSMNSAIKTVCPVMDRYRNGVFMSWESGQSTIMDIRTNIDDIKRKSTINVLSDGKPGKIAAEARFIDALTKGKVYILEFEYRGESNPMVFKNAANTSETIVIMPMFFDESKWENIENENESESEPETEPGTRENNNAQESGDSDIDTEPNSHRAESDF